MAELTLQEAKGSGKLVFKSSVGYQRIPFARQYLLSIVIMAVFLFTTFASGNQGSPYIVFIGIVVLLCFGWPMYMVTRYPNTELIIDQKLAILTKTVSPLLGRPHTTVLPFREIAALQIVMWGRRFPICGYSTLIVITINRREIRINEAMDRDEMESLAQEISAITGAPIKPVAYTYWAP